KLLESGHDVFLLRIPPKQDATQYAQSFNDPTRALGAILRHAQWLGKGEPPRGNVAVPDAAPTPLPASNETAELAFDQELDDLEDAELDAALDDEGVEAESAAVPNEPAATTPADDIPSFPLTASPIPQGPQEVVAQQNGDEVTIHLG